MDIVYVRGLKLETIVGIHDWERSHRRTVVLDLELATDIRPAAAADDIHCTVNYQAVSDVLQEFVGGSDFQLIETLAERCAGLLLEEFNLPWLRLRLSKPGALRLAADVGLVIERHRGDAQAVGQTGD